MWRTDISGMVPNNGNKNARSHRFLKWSGTGLLVLLAAGGVFAAFKPDILSQSLPVAVRTAPVGRLAHEVVWRLRFYVAKASGGVPQLHWGEVIQGTWPGRNLGGSWPGSGFINDKMVTEGRSLDASVFDPLQSARDVAEGKELFRANCAACHGNDGSGGAHAPSLTKPNYSVGSSDLALYGTLRDGIRGTAMASLDLSIKQRWQIIGFLRTLGHRAADQSNAVSRIPAIDVSWETLLSARNRTDDWLTYSGALDGWRHSPLDQINTANVDGLRLLWLHQFATANDDPFEASPIVTGRTIFMAAPPNDVVAIDARLGYEIWRYSHPLPSALPLCCGRVNRGLGVLGDTLFLGTLDAQLVAIDSVTGNVKWQTRVADPQRGFTITAAPLVVRNAVVVGISGGEFGIRGFLAAYDAKSGKQLWRFQTIPGPGEYGHDSWKNDAWKTGGGPTWITGSYDPDLNLLYWGVGNPSPNYASDVRPGDNLFTNSVIALDATTGKLVWHFQFTPHGSHDWDSNQTPILADLVIDGIPRKVICWANRNGFYYVLDRTDGTFLRGAPFVDVNWASGLDGNGRPILTDKARVTTHGMLTKPWVGGGTNWQPPSYDPATQTVLVHATEGSSIYTTSAPDNVKRGTGGLYVGSSSSVGETAINIVKAIDAASGSIKWQYASPRQQPLPDQTYGGILSTGGGLAFSTFAGNIFALDTATGKELWRSGLGGKTQATPISFLLDGKQVIAVTAGKILFLFGR